jgi:hypothetical protein
LVTRFALRVARSGDGPKRETRNAKRETLLRRSRKNRASKVASGLNISKRQHNVGFEYLANSLGLLLNLLLHRCI